MNWVVRIGLLIWALAQWDTPALQPPEYTLLLTATEVATLLRTTRKAVYAMIERGLLPGVTRIGRRVLVRSTDLRDEEFRELMTELHESE